MTHPRTAPIGWSIPSWAFEGWANPNAKAIISKKQMRFIACIA